MKADYSSDFPGAGTGEAERIGVNHAAELMLVALGVAAGLSKVHSGTSGI